MIKLQIIGNLGKDCLIKEVNGKNVINFSVAHTDRYKDAQGVQKEKTTWVECAYWTDKTTVAQYLVKGKTVFAEGAPEADAYIDRSNNAAATLRMRVYTLQLVGGGGEPSQNAGSANRQAAPAQDRYEPPLSGPSGFGSDAIDDLPF